MSQVYHSNARTNQHVRQRIQQSDLTNVELSDNYNVNVKTIAKHRKRDFSNDKSSRPNNIKGADCIIKKYSYILFFQIFKKIHLQ